MCVWRGTERTGSIPERGGGGRGGEWEQLEDGWADGSDQKCNGENNWLLPF